MNAMKKLIEEALRDNYLFEFNDVQSIKKALINTMVYVVGKDPEFASQRDWLNALAYLLRGILSERYTRAAREEFERDVRRIYYFSMEYLNGRSLIKHLIDLGLLENVRQALEEFGLELDGVKELEFDAALGNGGLGRLASCFLESMATHGYPGLGYGIRYEYGMFTQRIEDGQQVEHPENWLRYGNPWEFERPSVIFTVRFNGRIVCFIDETGKEVCQWVNTDDVIAMAFDVPVSGYGSEMVGNLRLWSARSSRDFDLHYFNTGNYVDAVKDKAASETLSKVLYPNDSTQTGQELRLKQEYFFVSASLQDILLRFMRNHDSLDSLPEKVAIQLNDTHPSLAIPELMRLLMDQHGYDWETAWEMSHRIFSYTNHTLLPEALETWSIHLIEKVLPRHLEIIFEINHHFLREVRYTFPGEPDMMRRMSLVDDAHGHIRMAHLAIVGSHKVNGVAELHTRLLQTTTFSNFHRMYPEKFVNMTNGISPRRWLLQANPGLAALITEHIGDGWIKDLSQLKKLEPLADDADFRARFMAVKKANKERLAGEIFRHLEVEVDPESLFDVQVKRIHEYKRQLLNLLHVITRYNQIRDGSAADFTPRTVLIGGKAAPSYVMAKLIVHLINDVAATVNNDPAVGGLLNLVFIPNYDVTTAEAVIPGADLSEQISTAGTEASGTGNMKFALNGALTIGTLDGANIEILRAVGEDNMFIFGLNADEAEELRENQYDPRQCYNDNPDLKRVLDMIGRGFFCPDEPNRYRGIVNSLLQHGDHYLLLADYDSYVDCQDRAEQAFGDRDGWARKGVINVANMGHFSSDRTIHDYAKEIWNVTPMVR